MISSEDAALLLSKFESEATLLKVSLLRKNPSITLSLQARVLGFTEGEILSLMTGTKDISFVSLNGCQFEYGDERAVPELIRDWATQKFEGALTILFPSDEKLTLRAFRSEVPSDL